MGEHQRVPVLAHIHVPKTAGTSFRKAIDTTFSSAAHLQLYYDNDTEFVYQDREIASFVDDLSVKAFSSHFVRRFPPTLAHRPIFYVTFLRDPVQQFVSYITYTKKHYHAIKDQVLLRHLPPEMPSLSIRECAHWILLEDCLGFRNFRENYATNFFARYPIQKATRFTYSDPEYREIRLGVAIDILSNFFFVGISEHMDESWQLLRRRASQFGILMPDLRLAHENVSSDVRDDLSWIREDDQVGQALLRSVGEDEQLYRWALDRFEEQFAACRAAA